MPRSMITFDTVQEIGLSMPGVEKGLRYGVPALKVQGQLLACVPVNPAAEPVRFLFASISMTVPK